MHILYATDGTPGALAAAPLLTELPLEAECRLTLLTTVEGTDETGARATLTATEEALSHVTASLDLRLRHGHAAEEIVQAAEELSADLIVLGSHGRSVLHRFLLGSTAERVARHSHCPVLLVRPGRPQLRRVVVALDGSDCSEFAAGWLRPFPWPADTEIRLLSVIPNLHAMAAEHFMLTPPLVQTSITFHDWQRQQVRERLDYHAAEFEKAGHRAVTEIRSGDPAGVLLHAATEESADLIAVGSHGYSGFDRLLLGSVSENILRHAHCSVLIVRR